MIQEKGDEPVVKLAKDFIENCKDFEVRELPQKEQAKSADEPKTEQPDNLRVVQYDEYVKTRTSHRFLGGEKYLEIEQLDETDILEKGGLKIFYNEEMDLKVEWATTSIMLQSLYIGEHVLSLSPVSKFDIGQYCSTIKEKWGEGNVASWFKNKPLYVCEYVENEGLMTCIDQLAPKIEALQITLLYLPKFECALANCSDQEQMQILKSLNDFAYKNHICILAALQPYRDAPYGFNVFNSMRYVQHKILEKAVPNRAIYFVGYSYDYSRAEIAWWDCSIYASRRLSIKMPENIYCRDVE